MGTQKVVLTPNPETLARRHVTLWRRATLPKAVRLTPVSSLVDAGALPVEDVDADIVAELEAAFLRNTNMDLNLGLDRLEGTDVVTELDCTGA